MNLKVKCNIASKSLLENIDGDGSAWLNHPYKVNKEQIALINKFSQKLKDQADILVVIGAGGSYLGTKAISEALLPKYKREREILYLGNNLSEIDLVETMDYLKGKDFVVNYISKSGGTLEPSVAYNLILDLLKIKYENYKDRIFIISGEGPLKSYATKENLDYFEIPNGIGGRYSVFTNASLIPLSFVGIDISELVLGAQKASIDFIKGDSWAPIHAIERIHLNQSQSKDVEILVFNEPRLHYFGEWWKQLYAESEGKDGKGIFPVTSCYSRDLHSIGQFIQEGKAIFFETQIAFKKEGYLKLNSSIPLKNASLLSNFSVQEMNDIALQGAEKAHLEGGVPVLNLEFDFMNEFVLGEVMQNFMISCAISALMINVNPFNQPGVEAYKKSMIDLLYSNHNRKKKLQRYWEHWNEI